MKIAIFLLTLFMTGSCLSQKIEIITDNLIVETSDPKFKGKYVLPINVSADSAGRNVFYIRNIGNKALTINKVESDIKTCGAISFPKNPIKTGVIDSIIVYRKTCCYIDTTFQSLSVSTNAEADPDFSFIVKSVFSAPLFSYTLSADSIRIEQQRDSIYTIYLKNTGSRNFSIKRITSDKDFIFSNFSYKDYPVLPYNGIKPGESVELKFIIRKPEFIERGICGIARIYLEPCFSKRFEENREIKFIVD